MKTVIITRPFTAYPNGKKQDFAEGQEIELADDFADLILGKGHARLKPGPKAETQKDAKR